MNRETSATSATRCFRYLSKTPAAWLTRSFGPTSSSACKPYLATAPATSREEAQAQIYDTITVGSGVFGAILAHELTSKGRLVLLLEASPGRDLSQHGYLKYLENFYAPTTKDNNAPFPLNPNAAMPRSPDLRQLAPGETSQRAY